MADELSDILLERSFESLDSDGNVTTISLRLGKPYMIPESGHSLKWHCPYQIVGIGLERIHEGPGIDAIDAMLISLRIAEYFLKFYGRKYSKKITWLDEEELGLYPSAQVEIRDQEQSLFEMGDDLFEKVFDDFFLNFRRKSEDASLEESENDG